MARYSQQLQLDKSMERKMLFEPSSLNKILRTELKKKLNMSWCFLGICSQQRFSLLDDRGVST